MSLRAKRFAKYLESFNLFFKLMITLKLLPVIDFARALKGELLGATTIITTTTNNNGRPTLCHPHCFHGALMHDYHHHPSSPSS